MYLHLSLSAKTEYYTWHGKHNNWLKVTLLKENPGSSESWFLAKTVWQAKNENWFYVNE